MIKTMKSRSSAKKKNNKIAAIFTKRKLSIITVSHMFAPGQCWRTWQVKGTIPWEK